MDTFIIKKNYKSDFLLREVFRNSDGDRVDIPDCDFRFVYSTNNSNKQYVASRKGDIYNNCRKHDDHTIEVIFNNHGLKPGILKKELQLDFPNDTFPDGIQNLFIPSCASIELWEGPSYGSKIIQDNIVVDYIATIIKDYNRLENKPILNLIGTEEFPVIIADLDPQNYNISGFIKIDKEKGIEISSTLCSIVQKADKKIAIFSDFVLIYDSVEGDWVFKSMEKIVTFPTDEDTISDYDPLINSYVHTANGWAKLNDFLVNLINNAVLRKSDETQIIDSDLTIDRGNQILGMKADGSHATMIRYAIYVTGSEFAGTKTVFGVSHTLKEILEDQSLINNIATNRAVITNDGDYLYHNESLWVEFIPTKISQQMDLNSETEHLNLNSNGRPTTEMPSGKEDNAFLSDFGIKLDGTENPINLLTLKEGRYLVKGNITIPDFVKSAKLAEFTSQSEIDFYAEYNYIFSQDTFVDNSIRTSGYDTYIYITKIDNYNYRVVVGDYIYGDQFIFEMYIGVATSNFVTTDIAGDNWSNYIGVGTFIPVYGFGTSDNPIYLSDLTQGRYTLIYQGICYWVKNQSGDLEQIPFSLSNVSPILLVHKTSSLLILTLIQNDKKTIEYREYSYSAITANYTLVTKRIIANDYDCTEYNVTARVPLSSGYYTPATARTAVPTEYRKNGLKITFQTGVNVWITQQFVATNLSAWDNDTSWVIYTNGNNVMSYDDYTNLANKNSTTLYFTYEN